MKEYYRVYADIDLDAIYENVKNAKALLKKDTKMMAIVKADGYGHGAVEVARQIDELVDAYGVAILEEGIELRKAGFTKPILILGYTPKPLYPAMIRYDIATAVFTMEMAKEISDTAVAMHKNANIHIKLDTGMSRIGFAITKESKEIIEQIAKLPGIEIEGMFTHFARADEADKAFTHLQYERYQKFHEGLEAAGVHIPMCHCANSAAIMELPRMGLDAARAGITVYGLYPSDEVERNMKIYPAMEIRSFITYVKEVEPGTPISYGGTFVTDRPMRIATIGAGYGDGYPRSLTGKGMVLIAGKRVPILGRICMDQFMVDVSEIPEAKVDTEVTLIGEDGNDRISMEEVADWCGGFHYEISCDLGKRIPRVYLKDGKVIGTKDYFDDHYEGFTM